MSGALKTIGSIGSIVAPFTGPAAPFIEAGSQLAGLAGSSGSGGGGGGGGGGISSITQSPAYNAALAQMQAKANEQTALDLMNQATGAQGNSVQNYLTQAKNLLGSMQSPATAAAPAFPTQPLSMSPIGANGPTNPGGGPASGYIDALLRSLLTANPFASLAQGSGGGAGSGQTTPPPTATPTPKPVQAQPAATQPLEAPPPPPPPVYGSNGGFYVDPSLQLGYDPVSHQHTGF